MVSLFRLKGRALQIDNTVIMMLTFFTGAVIIFTVSLLPAVYDVLSAGASELKKEQVMYLAEQIKQCVFDLHMENVNSKVFPEITISQGYCCFVPQKGVDLAGMMAMADKALYKVKESGRNGFEVIGKV